MSEWMDIETAPKDGSLVILSNDGGVWVGVYQPVYISGYKPKNHWSCMMLNIRHMRPWSSIVPTHWMPLPNPLSEDK